MRFSMALHAESTTACNSASLEDDEMFRCRLASSSGRNGPGAGGTSIGTGSLLAGLDALARLAPGGPGRRVLHAGTGLRGLRPLAAHDLHATHLTQVGSNVTRDVDLRSEERRVGKECRTRWLT